MGLIFYPIITTGNAMPYSSPGPPRSASRRCVAVRPVTLSLFCLASLVSLSTPSAAIVGRDDRASSLYNALGATAPFQAVGSLFVFNTQGAAGGTGTLLTSEWVLTAAHVVASNSTIVNSSFTLNGTRVGLAEIVRHPLWNGNITNGYDIALVRLATPITNATPAQLFTGRNELDFGTTAVNAGFGLQGDGVSGAVTPPTSRRAAQNDADFFGTFTSPTSIQFSATSGDYIMQDFDDPISDPRPDVNFMGSAIPRDLEGLIAPGDSGGPLMIDVGGGNYRVAGVHSFITAPDSFPANPQATYGWIAGSTRVSDHLPFIFSTIGVSAVVPEPGTLAFVVLGAGCWVSGRRRRRQR
jgi:secreted trypsin-like serine protease